MKRRTFTALLVALAALIFTHTTTRADDLKAMEGTWHVEAAAVGGQQIESGDLKEVTVTIKGDQYEVKYKDKRDAGTLKLDETQTPKAMDATDTEGDDVGKVVKAIYEIAGDTLRVCHMLDGGERPTELVSRTGTKWLLLTYKREKKAE